MTLAKFYKSMVKANKKEQEEIAKNNYNKKIKLCECVYGQLQS